VVFFDTKLNKYSFNSLSGVLDSEEHLKSIPVFFFKEEQELLSGLIELLENFKKVILGFSFFTTQVWNFVSLIKRIRRDFKSYRDRIYLIAGGPHPTGDVKRTLRAGVDFVFVGEAERSFKEFLEALLSKRDPFKVKGIAYLSSDEPVFTGKPSQVDLNEFAPFSLRLNRIGPIEITRGCPYGCFYCQTPRIFGGRVRHRNIENILYWVDKLLKRGIRDFRFITPNAFSYGSQDGRVVNFDALEELLKSLYKKIKTKNGRIFFGSFPSEVRPEHISEKTLELISRYADNKNLVIGAQSGSDRVLRLCNRKHTVEDVLRAVKLCKRFGLIPKVDFIFGLPGEEKEDVEQTIEVMQRLSELGAIIHAHTFMPLPQTPFSKEKPGELSPQLLKTINKLLGRGKLFGDWQSQKALSQKIYEYLKQL